MKTNKEKEISCRITKTLLMYVREKNNGSLGSLLEGLELDEKYLMDIDNWVSHDFLHVLYERMIRILQDEQAVYNMALASVRVKSLGLLERIVRLLGNPHAIYSQAPTYNKMLKLNGDVLVQDIGDSWVLIEDRYHLSHQKTHYDCDYTRGILQGIPTLFDLPPAQIEEIQCQVSAERYGKRTWEDNPAQGTESCLYRVKWSGGKDKKLSFWKQIFKYGLYLNIIRDLREANRKIQDKYNEARDLASYLQKINHELELARNQQTIYLEELKASEERYRLLAENITDVIWMLNLNDLRFTYTSPSVKRMRGFTAQEAMKLTPEETLTPQSLQNMMNILQEELAREGKAGVDPNRSRTALIEQYCKDGSIIWCEVKMTFLRDKEGHPVGVLGVTRDVNERVLTEIKLRKNEEHLRLITNNISDVITMTDMNLICQYLSPSYKKVLGYDPAQRIGAKLLEHVHPDDLALVKQTIRQAVETGQPSKMVHRYRHAQGDYIWLETVGDYLSNEEGVITGGMFVSRDVTQSRKAEQEKMLLEERLQRAEKMEALGTLAGGVAHDLNNVLGVVTGYAELILSETDESSKLRSRIMNIMQGGERAAAIVQDLLTMARRGVSTSKVINLNETILDYQKGPEYERLRSFHPKVEIVTSLEEGLLNIMGSPVHLSKTIMNLFLNAMEAMPDGGKLTIATRNQYLDKPVQGYDDVREGDYVVLVVSDTGEGIKADDLKRIFEPFYTKKVMGRSGTGLGLSVVWGTVKDHHGYIDVQSEEAKGTTLTLYFPVTREAVSTEEAALSLSEFGGQGESILVVDDVKEQRELAVQMMSKLNYRATAVGSGEEAVEYLKDGKADLVILDMIMDPGMDGLDTYLKILEIHPRQKAIIVSGYSDTDRVRKAQELGAGAYVRKPYVLEKIGLAVRKELDRSADKGTLR